MHEWYTYTPSGNKPFLEWASDTRDVIVPYI